MRAVDFALFSLINAGPTTSPAVVQAALYASDVLPSALVALLAGGALRDARWRRGLWMALFSLLVVWAMVTLFRGWLPMPRPAQLGLGIQWAPQGMRPGFPSMHVAGVAAFAFSLVFSRLRLAMVCALAVMALVAWSRLLLGLHFPSDVLGGLVAGGLAAWLVEGCAVVLRGWSVWRRAGRRDQRRAGVTIQPLP